MFRGGIGVGCAMVLNGAGMHEDAMSTEEARAAAVAAVKQLSADVGILAKMSELPGVQECDLPALAEMSFADVCTGVNPRDTSVEDILGIYKNAF